MYLTDKAAEVIMPVLLSTLMTLVVSLVTTVTALGLNGFTLLGSLKAWGMSWLIAYPTLLLVLPLVRRLTALIIRSVNHYCDKH